MSVDNYSTESEVAKRWLEYCRHHKYIKCMEFPVPDGILPSNYKGTLIDVKVTGPRWGADDKIYAENEDLRKNVARGNCVLELHPLDAGSGGDCTKLTQYLFLVFALRKFSGGLGDEDDSNNVQNMWQEYFLKPVEAATKVVCTIKANGEAAHVSCCRIGDKNFFAFGSKNVHLLAKTLATPLLSETSIMYDVDKYKDSRFNVACIVARAFFNYSAENMSEENLHEFKQFLNSMRRTAIFEILQPNYQHIVDLRYLKAPLPTFICWADAFSEKECQSLCGLEPSKGIEKARSFGLTTIDYTVIQPDEVEAEMLKIRSDTGYEGKVLYFVDEKDNVFGLIKKKTCWYILLRAIREKACGFSTAKRSTQPSSEMRGKVTKRIKVIQVWLGFSNEYRQSWTDLGSAFVEWAVTLSKKKPSRNICVRSQFPSLWEEFLDSSPRHKNIYDKLQYS